MLIEYRPFAASPCLHKILLAKFSSAKMFSRFAASPWGAFLAELPPYGCFGSLLSLKATFNSVLSLPPGGGKVSPYGDE